MIDIDIIIPSIFRTPKQYYKYQNLSIPTYGINLIWFPVWYYRKELKKMGFRVRFFHNLDKKYKTERNISKILCIDNKIIKKVAENFGYLYFGAKKQGILEFLKMLKKKVDYLIWFDSSDSTGTTRFEVLPYVDRYLKRALLKDRSLYTKNSYMNESRKYFEFYFKNYIVKKKFKFSPNTIFDLKYQHKLFLSWNLALSDYRSSNNLNRLLQSYTRKYKPKFYKPNLDRGIKLSANFSYKNSYPIYFQRQALLRVLLKKYKSQQDVSLGIISKKKYLKNLKLSKAVLSPFGWGEVCYRDIETFIAGAALIKPDMSHLETWPDLYKKEETYIPISWKIEKWNSEFEEILENKKLLFEVAKKGQNLYEKIWTIKGKRIFCERFITLMTPN